MKIKKIVDISMVLEEDLPSDPEIQIPHIQRRNHKDTAPEMDGPLILLSYVHTPVLIWTHHGIITQQ